MRVLGIDPGLQCTGYGLIEVKSGRMVLLEAGVIRSSHKEPLSLRLEKIYKGLCQIIEIYRPQVIALEELYSHYQHPRTAILMAHARGAICLLAAQSRIAVAGYAAKRVKKAVTGAGGAKKLQVQRVIKEMLGLKKDPAPYDVADALALAITHINATKRQL